MPPRIAHPLPEGAVLTPVQWNHVQFIHHFGEQDHVLGILNDLVSELIGSADARPTTADTPLENGRSSGSS